jgi:hypothetical protein
VHHEARRLPAGAERHRELDRLLRPHRWKALEPEQPRGRAVRDDGAISRPKARGEESLTPRLGRAGRSVHAGQDARPCASHRSARR